MSATIVIERVLVELVGVGRPGTVGLRIGSVASDDQPLSRGEIVTVLEEVLTRVRDWGMETGLAAPLIVSSPRHPRFDARPVLLGDTIDYAVGSQTCTGVVAGIFPDAHWDDYIFNVNPDDNTPYRNDITYLTAVAGHRPARGAKGES